MLVASAALLWLHTPIGAQPGANCSASFFVDETLTNGARWQLCWEHRSLDGIVLRDVYFTPPGGVSRRILAEGSIAQVHVPYDDNSARFHDITDDGFGDNNLNNLTAAECPGGALLQLGGKNAICQQIQPRGHAFKGLGMQAQGEQLSLFSVSTSGEYNYIPIWRFLDNGAVELLMGAAGKLQRFTTDSRYGWPVRPNGVRGTSHIHNYYWRLDFDLGEHGDDDVVEEFNYLASADNTRRALGVTRIINETARSIDPVGMRSWRIRDDGAANANGQPISYHLEPIDVAHRDVGPDFEPWTTSDFYVTRHRACERYASHNPQVSGCADNLAAFVNGESLVGADVVLWYGVTFHHIARDEDEPMMHTHWSGFRLVPRDWMDANPVAADLVTCAVGDVTCDGQIDAADALFMLQYDVGLRATSGQLPLPDGALYTYACDVSGEGACNAIDALLTLQCDVGLPNRFCPPVEGLRATEPAQAAAPVVVTVGNATQSPHDATRVTLRAAAAAEIGALSITATYDPNWRGDIACVADPAASFALSACHVDPAAGVVRFSLVSPAGVAGDIAAGEIVITPPNELSTAPLVMLDSVVVAAPNGAMLATDTQRDDEAGRLFLPLVER
ncbi:MAG: hypothetical protein KJZ93_28280 [Caldilineaceae bacterium]|nr:hypothetical protein [Caldilineaceae bacterium]